MLTGVKSTMNTSPLIETNAILTPFVGNRAAKDKDAKNMTKHIKFHTTVSLCGAVL